MPQNIIHMSTLTHTPEASRVDYLALGRTHSPIPCAGPHCFCSPARGQAPVSMRRVKYPPFHRSSSSPSLPQESLPMRWLELLPPSVPSRTAHRLLLHSNTQTSHIRSHSLGPADWILLLLIPQRTLTRLRWSREVTWPPRSTTGAWCQLWTSMALLRSSSSACTSWRTTWASRATVSVRHLCMCVCVWACFCIRSN